MKQLRIKYLLHREEGISLAEFALILPIFLGLLLGMVDLGHGFNTYLGMHNAAREGSFWIMRNSTDVEGMNARITTELARVGLTLEDLDDSEGSFANPAKLSYDIGDIVTVRLAYSYDLLFGALTGLPSLTLRVENTVHVLH